MLPEQTLNVRVDDAFLGNDRAYIDLVKADGSLMRTSFPFDKNAPQGSSRRKRWKLALKLGAWHGLDERAVVGTRLRCIIGKFYRLRFVAVGPDHWIIDAGKAIDPFEIDDLDSEESWVEFERAMGIS